MAYQTGVSSSIPDLINAVMTFAQTQGFTAGPTQEWATNTIDPGSATLTFDIYSLQKGGAYFLFAIPRSISAAQSANLAADSCLYLNTSDSWTGSQFNNRDPVWTKCARFDGPHVGYHLFSDGNTVCVAVELVTNVFNHFVFGDIVKNGNWTGGQIVLGQYWFTGSSRPPWNGYDNSNFVPFGNSDRMVGSGNTRGYSSGHVRTSHNPPVAALAHVRTSGYSASFLTCAAVDGTRPLVDNSPNTFNGRSVLVPAQVVQGTSGSGQPFFQLGYIGNLAYVNIRDIQPKQMVNGDWMVFPAVEKNGSGNPYPNTGTYGYAFRK